MHSARFKGTFLILAQIKEGGTAKIIGLPFCISFLKGLRTRTLCHSLHFNLFFLIQEYFCQIFQISQTKEGIELISWGERTNSPERLNCLVPHSVFQF